MASLVFISDTHISAPAKSPVTVDGKNRRLLELTACLYKALETAVASKAEIVHGGDFFHDRKGVRPEALEAAGRWLEACRDAGVRVNLLVGNHDMSDGGDGSASVYALSGLARIVKTPQVLECSGIPVAFMPYCHSPERIDAAISKMSGQFLVGHLGLGDPRFSSVVPSDYETPGVLSLKHLHPERFSQIMLGHYHNKQTVVPGVDYMGCPLQLDKSDANKPRGIWLYKGGKLSFIENTWSPKYRVVSAAEAIEIVGAGSSDYIVATAADQEEAAELRVLADKTGAFVKVERKAASAQASRMPSDTPADRVVKVYVDIAAPDKDPSEREALVQVGQALLSKTLTDYEV